MVKVIQGLYPRIAHQICTFYKANDLGVRLGDKRHRRQTISDALRVFEGETEAEVRKRLRIFRDRWSINESQAVRNFIRGFEDCLVYLLYPDPKEPC